MIIVTQESDDPEEGKQEVCKPIPHNTTCLVAVLHNEVLSLLTVSGKRNNLSPINVSAEKGKKVLPLYLHDTKFWHAHFELYFVIKSFLIVVSSNIINNNI